MSILQLSDVGLNPGGRAVFRGLGWVVQPRERTGLVGANACGKSSLLRVMAGVVPADEGTVSLQRGKRVGFLPQELEFEDERSVLDVATVPPPDLVEVEGLLADLERQLAEPAVYRDEDRMGRVLARQERALTRYAELGGASYPGRVRSLLLRFGFAEADWQRPVRQLSGGQKKLVALVALAAQAPDLLLLDEPDNHLDVDAKGWLETFMRDYDGAIIVVSHDRYLLDATVNQIAELEDARLTLYAGGFTAYATERELRRLHQKRARAAQQKEIGRIEASIARFEHWARLVVNERHIKQARSRRRALDKLEERGEIIEAVREPRSMGLVLSGSRGSDKALELRDLSMGFGDDLLFVGLDLLIRHGERVGLVGPNGAGKSVLFQIALGKLPALEGRAQIGAGTRVSYYAQQHETLSAWLDRTPLERIRDVAPMSEGSAVAWLLKFLFDYGQVRQKIRGLSGGERSRLQLLCLMLEQPNLLLLDEPTNNLDIRSAEVLEAVLEDFEGAVWVISHDRYFLDTVVDRIVELREGELRSFEGGYTDYLIERTERTEPS